MNVDEIWLQFKIKNYDNSYIYIYIDMGSKWHIRPITANGIFLREDLQEQALPKSWHRQKVWIFEFYLYISILFFYTFKERPVECHKYECVY